MKTNHNENFSNSYWSWDVFMMGGLSIFVCIGFWMFFDKSISLLTISQTAATLAFVVNHPHFLSSYMLLYGDFRNKITERKRYFFAGVIAPAILLAFLVTAMVRGDRSLMGHIVTAMFFLVGWHYVKQVFGCIIVSSAQRKIYYKPFERRLLLANLIPVWFMSFLGTHVGNNSFDFYGIPHYSLQFPAWTLQFCFWAVAITAVSVVVMQTKKYIREGHKPSPPAVAAFVALYAWYLPVMAHPAFGYLIPLFHSLQYLSFVWLLKRNQVSFDIRELKEAKWREAWIKNFGGFAIGALILGATFFEYLPKGLDAQRIIPAGELGYAPFLAAFLLFINIHHYFIDNAIWRSDNDVVKKFLMQPTAVPNEGSSSKAA